MTSNNEHAGCPDCCLYIQFSTRGTTVLREMTESWARAEKNTMNQGYLLITKSLLGVCQKVSGASLKRCQLAKIENFECQKNNCYGLKRIK